jgi:exopolysaccharide production protein ExoZ
VYDAARVESPANDGRSKQTLSSIQALRAFAAWCVVCHHYCLIFPVAHPGMWRRMFIDHGATGVDIFFVVSGLVMALSVSDSAMTPRRFVVKRIARIVPAYWLFTFAILAVIVWLPGVMLNQGYSLELLVKSLLFVPAQNPNGLGFLPINTVGWTLNLEVMFYLVVAGSLFVPTAQRWLCIAVGLLLVQRVLSPLAPIGDFYRDPVIYEFMMGIAAAQLWRSGALSRGPAWVYGGFALLALYCLTRPDPPWGLVRAVDCGPAAFVLVCAVLGLERYFSRMRLLVHLGDHSYSVYLVHPTILYVGYYAVREWGWSRPVVAWSCFAVIALLGAASYRFVERPAGRLVTRALLT